MQKKKILRLWNDWALTEARKKENGYGGCGYYRVIKPSEQLSPEHEITVWGNEVDKKLKELDGNVEDFYTYIFTEFDMVWMHYTDNDKMFAWLYAAKEKFGKKLVMDIDDNFLDLDPSNPANAQVGKGTYKRNALATILSFCDAVTVSTVPLKKRIEAHFKERGYKKVPIFVMPNYNDLADWNYKKEKSKEGVVIGYMGSLSHKDDLDMILPQIKQVLEENPEAGFQVMGQLTFEDGKKIFKDWDYQIRKRVFVINPTHKFEDFPYWLSQHPWDIGIAPLIESKFNECKSHIKWMEYSMYKIPTVASKVYPYFKKIDGKNTIVDGKTGILCKPNEWKDKLTKLIKDKELREKIGNNAYEYVKDNWQYKDAKKDILSIADKLSML